jgi:hypothetical protein
MGVEIRTKMRNLSAPVARAANEDTGPLEIPSSNVIHYFARAGTSVADSSVSEHNETASPIEPSSNECASNDTVRQIGAHADYRLQDYYFPRTQSRAMNAVKWGSRIKPMLSWSEIMLRGLLIALLSMATFSLVR